MRARELDKAESIRGFSGISWRDKGIEGTKSRRTVGGERFVVELQAILNSFSFFSLKQIIGKEDWGWKEPIIK